MNQCSTSSLKRSRSLSSESEEETFDIRLEDGSTLTVINGEHAQVITAYFKHLSKSTLDRLVRESFFDQDPRMLLDVATNKSDINLLLGLRPWCAEIEVRLTEIHRQVAI